LHALDLFDPRAASQCYPHMFATLLGDLDGTGATVEELTEVLPDDDWLEFLMLHVGIIKCEPEGALTFFVTEIIEQMLRRINERYPVTKGYSRCTSLWWRRIARSARLTTRWWTRREHADLTCWSLKQSKRRRPAKL
jgi:hypothetical protein